jgi:ribose-phosphate pyrophosphokinase
VLHVVGEVENKICIIFDDMVDTAGTVCNGADALKKHGAKEFYLAATHAVFSGPAIERLKKADFKQIVVTNTIPLGDKKFDKIKVISTAPLFAEAILRNNSHESVSELFK